MIIYSIFAFKSLLIVLSHSNNRFVYILAVSINKMAAIVRANTFV
jgi:hypothetical protein